ncbi:MAG: hypothetical protein LBH98_04510 [Chitinispirillales bacterium]|nr:hypothetical protein [Chitinispirillales bacterium]
MQETINNLYLKKSAIESKNYSGLPVSLAYVKENYPHEPKKIVENYNDFNNYNSCETLFIYSVAKGDINRIINKNYCGYSPILQEQAKQVAQDLGLEKCNIMVSANACAAGAAAIDTARLFLQAGEFEQAVIFGFEQISEFVIKGFNALQALSPTAARPFDKNRNGMSLGEGSGICVLKPGMPKSGEICVWGSGASNDANHRTGPSRTGDGLALAIERALKSANLSPKRICAIKCHGTATPYNDAMEAKALKLIFGDNIPPIVSLKGAIGHLSGAGSLIETIICAEFLKNGKIAPTLNFEEFEGEEKITISGECQNINGNHILCLSAGFGGLNAAVILGKS